MSRIYFIFWYVALALAIACSSRREQENPELADAPAYAQRFYRAVTNEFNPAELLEWGEHLFAQENSLVGMLQRDKWPPFLVKKSSRFANPTWISITTDPNGKKRTIMIEYAGSFGQKGIAIVPSKDVTTNPRSGTLFIRWVDGVYIYNSP